MKYKAGDRVECILGYQGGVFPGERGTVLWTSGDGVGVRWDEYRSKRHSCGELCEMGHGWWVPYRFLEVVEELDLGDFSKSIEYTQLISLFGGVL